ncbi:N-terminal EF-hand calcium-binding protein 1-like isoform X5 [Branchiostoma floridae x Branchiostoma japonicum]
MADGEENSASPAGTPTAAEPPKKGMSAFLDVFRRADKNDDGKLSWYEFKTYFDDGSLSETELGELFHRIDTHNTNNIDVGELCDYFSQQLGPFEQVYSALEDLNSSINTALMSTAQDYPSMPQEGQFMRRFLLKEVLNQMESQQRSVDVASEHLEQESGSQDPVDAKVEEEPQLSRARRRDIRRQMSGLSRLESHEDNSAALTQQVNRLKTLLDTLQSKVRLQPIEEELDMEDGASLVQVVQRRMEMEEDKEEEFRKALMLMCCCTDGVTGPGGPEEDGDGGR